MTPAVGPLSCLFPDPPRSFRGRRLIKISLRAIHVLLVAAVFGAVLFDVTAAVAWPWWCAALGSGAAMLAIDLHESCVFLVQARGLVVVVKLGLVGSALVYPGAATALLAAAILLAVLSSHAPSRLRYAVIFGRGRFRPSKSGG